jgi:hypothetical protein
MFMEDPKLFGGGWMTKRSAGAVACFLVWAAIFVSKTVLPRARMFYGGFGGAGRSWRESIGEHGRLRRFIAATSRQAAAAEGTVLFAYGQTPEFNRTDDLLSTLTQIKYLLYPARPYNHSIDPSAISWIAIYHTRQEIFRELPFCRQVGESDYLCRVSFSNEPWESCQIGSGYNTPDLNIMARTIGPAQQETAFIVVSIQDFPIQRCFDLNALLTGQPAGGAPHEDKNLHRLHLSLSPVGPAPLPVYQFRLFIVDKKGKLYRSEESRFTLNSSIP